DRWNAGRQCWAAQRRRRNRACRTHLRSPPRPRIAAVYDPRRHRYVADDQTFPPDFSTTAMAHHRLARGTVDFQWFGTPDARSQHQRDFDLLRSALFLWSAAIASAHLAGDNAGNGEPGSGSGGVAVYATKNLHDL